MAILRRLYSKAYNDACAVDEDTASLVLEAYNNDQISGTSDIIILCQMQVGVGAAFDGFLTYSRRN